MRANPRWAIMISGQGSNLQVWLDHLEMVDLRWVVSTQGRAPGLIKAKRRGIPTAVLEKKINWERLNQEMIFRGISHIMLAGFMRVIPAEFLRKWEGRILNIHPSLLPSFPGLKALERSFAENAPMGVSVHQVVAEVDAGSIIFQKKLTSSSSSQARKQSWVRAKMLASLSEHQLMREVVHKWNNEWI